MMFLMEAAALCLIFTAIVVFVLARDPLAGIADYPPAIGERAMELKLIPLRPLRGMPYMVSKVGKALAMSVVLALVLVFVNKVTSFSQAFFLGYGLWLVVTWYDALVLDCGWFCHSKKCVIPGTEDMTSAYHDYGFHVKASVIGTLLGLPTCVIAAALSVAILHLLH